MVLEGAGYKVQTAQDGSQALQTLDALGPLPAAIILDLQMPVMTGWQFLTEMRSAKRTVDIPVIVVSGEEVADPQALACAAFLAKPASPDKLLPIVKAVTLARGTLPSAKG